MFKLYDTEKELTLQDYKPLPGSLLKFTLSELYTLSKNLETASENAWIYHNDLLALAIDMDIKKVDLYIRMKERKQEREGIKQ